MSESNMSSHTQRVAEVMRPKTGGEKKALTTTTAASVNTYNGFVDLSTDADCFIRFGAAAVVDTDYKLLSGFSYRFRAENEQIHGICASGTANLDISPVE